MAGETMKSSDVPVKAKERDGDLLEKTFHIGENVVKVHWREITGSVIGNFSGSAKGEITSLKCDSTVEFTMTDGTLNIKRIFTEGNDFTYGKKATGNFDKCATALKRSGIVEAMGKMTEQGCWNDIVIEVSEEYVTNREFTELIPASRAAETRLPPKR